MAFKPIVGNDVKQMDEAIFRDAPMGLSSQFFN
jgi:acyl CoA:acetate/3-ketoacid CoA transferase